MNNHPTIHNEFDQDDFTPDVASMEFDGTPYLNRRESIIEEDGNS
jgi:hypothetical protein